MDDELLLCPGIDVLGGIDALGIDVLPEGDFLAFLGELAAEPPRLNCPTTQHEPPAVLQPSAADSTKAPALALPAAAQWQVTTGQQGLQQEQPNSRGSPCSSAASADATNCPESPMVSSRPASNSEAAPTAPVSVTTGMRKRQRTSLKASPTASAPSSRQLQSPQDSQEQEEQPPMTKAQLAAAKRRAPVVDWRAIDDPEERRKQRRLAKNRVTAAR